ncbi:hypothetical protein KDA_05070 [Dictyobacter alpinus]|uniref:Zinc-ribbon domain-containing protein n=1 Tax=Dictyobacter alpinus TaxID=2014873 RepID=A0A402B105_9CHLR|nr:zinc ribbon domain-containing protein [Dictyobacter alpinus]GCE25023.1 hypothetical protein KDA_05070 [Dictyobacter alpinus]
MIFCGQCGLQLAPGSTRCPRCGAAIDEASATTEGEFHADDATVATPSLLNRNSPTSQPPAGQKPLILRPGTSGTQANSNDYGTPDSFDYDSTSVMEQANQNPAGGSYPGYPPQTNTGFPTQSGGNYPTQSGGNYPSQMYTGSGTTQGGGAYGTGMSYPNLPQQQMEMGYSQPHLQNPYQQQQAELAARAARGRTTGLILVLCGLIFILTAVVLFALQSGLFGGNKAFTPEDTQHLVALWRLYAQ